MVKVAVVQAEPVWSDVAASVEKTNSLIREAASNGASLIAFPEVFIPGYPLFIWINAAEVSKNIDYVKNSLSLKSSLFESIKSTAKDNNIAVVLGFSELDNNSTYISQVVINREGDLVLKRRKFNPTHVERVMYGDGTKTNFHNVVELNLGEENYNVGCLNCWEHAQPLITAYGAHHNEQLHVGGWPPLAEKAKATGETLESLCKDGVYALARAYAIQNGCYYLMFNAVISQKAIDAYGPIPNIFCVGGGCAAIFGPDGSLISETLDEFEEGIIYADISKDFIGICKHFLDPIGHYSRPDMFSLSKSAETFQAFSL
ncbi:hypothetical protein KL925_000773 [Ogataea polymorpha]|nr:hypothetical protein KL925_000773 [Ogataea polymorpha]